MTDLIGGQIDVMIADMATGLQQVKAGKLKALGVSTKQRSPLAPELPTIDEAGVKGYDIAAQQPVSTNLPARRSTLTRPRNCASSM